MSPSGMLWVVLGAVHGIGCNPSEASKKKPDESTTETTTRPAPSTSSQPVKSVEKPKLDPAAALDACKKGDAQACSGACDGGDLPSCVTFAEKLLSGSDLQAKTACEAPLRKACDGNNGRACSALARCLSVIILAERRKTYAMDKTKQAEANEKACKLDDGLGCFSIAKNYEEGFGVDQDDAKAAELMKKAISLMAKECDAGDGKTCLYLGMLYNPTSKSKAVVQDEAKSKGFYKKACDAGEANACEVLKLK